MSQDRNKPKVQEAKVDDGTNYHDLLKDEQKRFQESKAPRMSDLTSEEFLKLVSGAGGNGGPSLTIDDIRQVVKEEIAAALHDAKLNEKVPEPQPESAPAEEKPAAKDKAK